jgi:hypothetical protein
MVQTTQAQIPRAMAATAVSTGDGELDPADVRRPRSRRWPRRLELLVDRHEPEILQQHLLSSAHIAAER